MSFVAAAVGAVGVIGAMSAADAQSSAAQAATANSNSMYQQTQGHLLPYQQAGATSIGALSGSLNANPTGGVGGTPGLLTQFGPAQLQSNLAPNYNFGLAQGQGALQNQNAAAGGAFGGNSQTGMEAFTANYAQNAYQQAFNNFQAQQTNAYNRLSGVAQIGETAAAGGTTGAPSFAQTQSGTIVGQGTATAGGIVGAANAAGGAGTGAYGYYTLGQMLNKGGTPNTGGGGFGASLANTNVANYGYPADAST